MSQGSELFSPGEWYQADRGSCPVAISGEGLLRVFSTKPYHGLYLIAKTGPRVMAEIWCGMTEGELIVSLCP